MRFLFSAITSFIMLLGITSSAYACGLYGYHPQIPQEPDPWVPLISFAAIVFGFMLLGRSLPRISQGTIMGLLFALATTLGVFSISILNYPEAYLTKMLLIPTTLIIAVALLGYKSKQALWGLGKYGLGIIIGLTFYLPMSNYIPSLKSKPKIEWVSTLSSTPATKKSTSTEKYSKRPAFAVTTQKIAESARTPSENNENSSGDK